MSVLQGIKGTFQSVQQDLVDGFKALTSFESHPKSEALRRLRGDGVNLDAGADLLYRYHLSWREIDSYSKESAKRAEGVDEEINKIHKTWSKQDNLVHHLDESVKQIPVLLEVLSNLTASIGELEESFRMVEEDLEKLEDVCEEQELFKQQQNQIHQLQQYKHQKSKEIEKVKVQMARDHAKRMIELEKLKSFKLQERHEAFEAAFTSDLSYYKEHGKTDQLKLPDIPKVSSLSDISIDQDEKAFNEFLSSQTTSPVVEQTIGEDDDEIHMDDIVVTSEESFIDDDYTKDYGHDINTLPDSDSSQEEDSTVLQRKTENIAEKSGSKVEDNSKEPGSKVEDNSKESGSKVEDNSKEPGSKTEYNSKESGSKVEDSSKESAGMTEDSSKESGSKAEDNSKESGSKTEDNSRKSGSKSDKKTNKSVKKNKEKSKSNKSESKIKDTSKSSGKNTEDNSKREDISLQSDSKAEDLSDQMEIKTEDNQDTTKQSSNEDLNNEDITNEDTPEVSDNSCEDNQTTVSEVLNDPGDSDKDIPQQSLSKDQNDNDSKVS